MSAKKSRVPFSPSENRNELSGTKTSFQEYCRQYSNEDISIVETLPIKASTLDHFCKDELSDIGLTQ